MNRHLLRVSFFLGLLSAPLLVFSESEKTETKKITIQVDSVNVFKKSSDFKKDPKAKPNKVYDVDTINKTVKNGLSKHAIEINPKEVIIEKLRERGIALVAKDAKYHVEVDVALEPCGFLATQRKITIQLLITDGKKTEKMTFSDKFSIVFDGEEMKKWLIKDIEACSTLFLKKIQKLENPD